MVFKYISELVENKKNSSFEFIGYLAPILLFVSYLAQIIKIIKEQNEKELSWIFIIGCMILGFSHIIYGVSNIIRPQIVHGLITFSVTLTLMVLKIYYSIKNKKNEELKEKLEKRKSKEKLKKKKSKEK